METAMGRIQRVLRAQRGNRVAGCHHKHDMVALFDGYEPMHALVAEQGDQLLGLTHFIFHRSTTSLGRSAICRTCSRWKPPEEEAWDAR